jgi:hypothetical protein
MNTRENRSKRGKESRVFKEASRNFIYLLFSLKRQAKNLETICTRTESIVFHFTGLQKNYTGTSGEW